MLVALSLARAGDMNGPTGRAQHLGRCLSLAGLIAYPLAGVLAGLVAGMPWSRVEVFGISPEPTALATLGLLLARPDFLARRWHGALLVIPVLSLLVGAATQLAMAG